MVKSILGSMSDWESSSRGQITFGDGLDPEESADHVASNVKAECEILNYWQRRYVWQIPYFVHRSLQHVRGSNKRAAVVAWNEPVATNLHLGRCEQPSRG